MTSDAAPPARTRRGRGVRGAAGWLLPVVLLLAVRLLVAEPERVVGPSMQPTLRDGDVVLAVRPGLVGLLDRLDRGDLVALRDPTGGGSIVKRAAPLSPFFNPSGNVV